MGERRDVQGIRDRLAMLRALDVKLGVFGAREHGYRLNPPIDVGRLAAVEARLGAPLPDGYRAFITELGDGGAGPYWGFHPLETGIGRVTELWGDAPLSARFPLEDDVDFGVIAGKPAAWQEHVRRLRDDVAYVAAWDALQNRYHAAPTYAGTLPICDFGDGEFFFMVVRGAHPGRIWVNGVDNGTGLFDLRVDFVEFYGRWLDDAIARARAGDFKTRNVGWGALEFGENPRYERASGEVR